MISARPEILKTVLSQCSCTKWKLSGLGSKQSPHKTTPTTTRNTSMCFVAGPETETPKMIQSHRTIKGNLGGTGHKGVDRPRGTWNKIDNPPPPHKPSPENNYRRRVGHRKPQDCTVPLYKQEQAWRKGTPRGQLTGKGGRNYTFNTTHHTHNKQKA